jgi:hypothetical protein
MDQAHLFDFLVIWVIQLIIAKWHPVKQKSKRFRTPQYFTVLLTNYRRELALLEFASA